MNRLMMRSSACLLIGLAVSQFSGLARDKALSGVGDITSDPFTFYYAYYLPNQQMQAMRPRPIDTINAAVQNRQYYAQTQQKSLYNPISPYTEEFDPLRPYSQRQGEERIAACLTDLPRTPRTPTVPAHHSIMDGPQPISRGSELAVGPTRTSSSFVPGGAAWAWVVEWAVAWVVEWAVVVEWAASCDRPGRSKVESRPIHQGHCALQAG